MSRPRGKGGREKNLFKCIYTSENTRSNCTKHSIFFFTSTVFKSTSSSSMRKKQGKNKGEALGVQCPQCFAGLLLAATINSFPKPQFTRLSAENDNRGKFHTWISSQMVLLVSRAKLQLLMHSVLPLARCPREAKFNKSFQWRQWLRDFPSHLISLLK